MFVKDVSDRNLLNLLLKTFNRNDVFILGFYINYYVYYICITVGYFKNMHLVVFYGLYFMF